MVAAFPAEASAAPKFPPVPVPTSREEADRLILEIGRANALEEFNDADHKKAAAALKADYSARNVVVVEGVKVPIADYRTQREEAVAAWAQANRDSLISEKLKTLKLNFGALQWKKAPDALEGLDGQGNSGRASLLDKLHEYLVDKLMKFPDLSQAALCCLNPQLTWRRSALLAARQDGRLEADELRKIGFKVVAGEEAITIKPSPVDLSSQPTTSS